MSIAELLELPGSQPKPEAAEGPVVGAQAPEAEVEDPGTPALSAMAQAIADDLEPEPAPVEQAEAAEPDDDAPQGESRAQQRIRQEIEKRKELESRLESVQQHNAMMEQRFNVLLQQMQQDAAQPAPPEQPQVEEVAFDDDPATHLLNKQQAMEAKLAQQEAAEQQRAQENAQRAQLQQLSNQYDVAAAQFAQQNPDYVPKVQALEKARLDYYQNAVGMSPHEASQAVGQEALGIILGAMQRGRDPVRAIYELASQQPVTPDPVQQVQREAQAQAAPTSLGSRNTAGTSKPLTWKDLGKMSDADFAKATAGNNWKRLMSKAR